MSTSGTPFVSLNSPADWPKLVKQLTEIRIERGLSQSDLAGHVRTSVNTIRRFESGKGINIDSFISIWNMLVGPLQPSQEQVMPLYTYECESCAKTEDRYAALSEMDDLQTCDKGHEMKRVEIPTGSNVAPGLMVRVRGKTNFGQILEIPHHIGRRTKV